MATAPPFFSLPAELFYNILSRLPPQDLALLSATCKLLHHHASDDRLWQMLVQDNVPGVDVASAALPHPITSFRELFLAHHPHWFLPRYKIWIDSNSMIGTIIIARYDPRRACIEGYQLLATKVSSPEGSPEVTFLTGRDLFGTGDPDDAAGEGPGLQPIQTYSFTADVHLHLDRSIIWLDPWLPVSDDEPEPEPEQNEQNEQTTARADTPSLGRRRPRPTARERPRPRSVREGEGAWISPWVAPFTLPSEMVRTSDRVIHQFVYARAMAPEVVRSESTYALPATHDTAPRANAVIASSLVPGLEAHGSEELQPFLTIPPRASTGGRDPRQIHMPYGVYRVWPPPNVPVTGAGHRVWCRTAGERGKPAPGEDTPSTIAQMSERAFYICMWLDMRAPVRRTFATIDPYFYTPTADKPFRGIWVGDYGGHGGEFLLLHQPDLDGDDNDLDDRNATPRLATESSAEHGQRRRDRRVFRGSLEAIKLTGDPNVPRGEYSFVAGDLSAGRVITQGPLAGARIIPSEGHVAGRGFRNNRFAESHLIVISPDRLAQFWAGSGYISYFHRVDIDQYTSPY